MLRNNGKPIRVVLVDDHELIRQGLALAFSRDPEMQVIGQAASVASALAAFEALKPDVVVTDLHLPDGTGFDVVRTLRTKQPDAGLVVLTMDAGDEQIFTAMEVGASGFVGKDAPAQEVVNTARHSAVSPRTFLCAGLPAAMMRRATESRPQLSPREREVLGLLAEGLGTGQIAKQLHMSESTAKTHIAKIYDKLGAANRAQALVAAMRLGMLDSFLPQSR